MRRESVLLLGYIGQEEIEKKNISTIKVSVLFREPYWCDYPQPTRRRAVSCLPSEPSNNHCHCGLMAVRDIVQKKSDQNGAFFFFFFKGLATCHPQPTEANKKRRMPSNWKYPSMDVMLPLNFDLPSALLGAVVEMYFKVKRISLPGRG
jgi:hypothetical protein